MTASSITLPTITINGTDPDALYEQAREAGDALLVAINAAQNANPNARDYYFAGFAAAQSEFAAHLAALTAAREFFMQHAMHALDAADARDARKA